MLEAGRKAAVGLLNAKDRSAKHIALGAAICVGAVAVSALIAGLNAPRAARGETDKAQDKLDQSGLRPPEKAFALVWPPLFTILAISGIRIWNAKASPERTRALGLWGAIQALQAVWTAWGPNHRMARMASAFTTLGVTAAYAHEAAKVDDKAAGMLAPYAGWISFAKLMTDQPWRKNRPRGATLH